MVDRPYVLAFDTSNEVVTCALGLLDPQGPAVDLVASREVEARRASNTTLVPLIDELCAEASVARASIVCVAVGAGPGSFTGVRIAMATAKGIASALGCALIALSTADVVAWGVWASCRRGLLTVVADAMRREVYPVDYRIDDGGVTRLSLDRVAPVDQCAAELACKASSPDRMIAGDGLRKYRDRFEGAGTLLPEALWTPAGAGLLMALEARWREGVCDPFDAKRHDPGFALPVYTRLSDAEENERVRLARTDQHLAGARGSKHVTMNDTAVAAARADGAGVAYKPLDATHAEAVAAMEARIMGSDAWNAAMVADELGRPDRIWWAAYQADPAMPVPPDAPLVGYAGGWVVDGDLQILKIGTDPTLRRHGIARTLLARLGDDGRNLGARTSSLEVRRSNVGAQAFYGEMGYKSLGVRPRYYSDGEDALILKADEMPRDLCGVAGMDLVDHGSAAANEEEASFDGPQSAVGTDRTMRAAKADEVKGAARPLILAIESSCDETAAAVADADGVLLSDVIASQVDFHGRFGGVVPEIASRKHVEAICGVCDEALTRAGRALGASAISWRDLDAVAVTYAPGLVGALVVGVAFAKGAAWGADIPFIIVNHLEGHLYANRIGLADFTPPAVVSLVSGGNTMLVVVRGWGDYRILGTTIDDAVGEAFDKVAKALGLGYPGGPVISRFAAQGDPDAIPFPRAMMHSGDLRFSLSGLKTAVVTYINGEREAGRALNVPDICASFQQAVVDVQISKAKRALEETGAPTFCLGGGVAANPRLREAYEAMARDLGVRLVMPPLSSCGDNAGMIALVALDRFRAGKFSSLDADALAHGDLEEPY